MGQASCLEEGMSVVQLLGLPQAASRKCAIIKTKLQVAQDEMDNFAPKSCFCGGMQRVAGVSNAALLPLPTGGHGPAWWKDLNAQRERRPVARGREAEAAERQLYC